MSLPEIRDEWGVPARLGQRVSIPGVVDTGTIVGGGWGWISVLFDDGSKLEVHPAALTYLKGDR